MSKTITSEIIGLGTDPEYTEFVEHLAGQLDQFDTQEPKEPSIEFARRLIGQFCTFVDQGAKRKKLQLVDPKGK